MMHIILSLWFFVLFLHRFKQLLLLCLDEISHFIESPVETLFTIRQQSLHLSKDILGMLVTLRRLLENEVIEILLQLLHLASEVEEYFILKSVKGLLKRAILGLMLNERLRLGGNICNIHERFCDDGKFIRTEDILGESEDLLHFLFDCYLG